MNSLRSKWNLLWCGLPACFDDYRSPAHEIVFVIVSPLVESSDTSLISQTEEAIWQSRVKMAPLSPLNSTNSHSFVGLNHCTIFYISLRTNDQMTRVGAPKHYWLCNTGLFSLNQVTSDFWNVSRLKWLLWGWTCEAWLIGEPCFLPYLNPRPSCISQKAIERWTDTGLTIKPKAIRNLWKMLHERRRVRHIQQPLHMTIEARL